MRTFRSPEDFFANRLANRLGMALAHRGSGFEAHTYP